MSVLFGSGDGGSIGFVYVETSRLGSVLRHGYMSARESVERGLCSHADIEEKYGPQLREARAAWDDCPATTLDYLDWRHEPGRGASAVYYLPRPIPETQRDAMAEFLKDRVLLRLVIPGDWNKTVVGGRGDACNLQQISVLEWEAAWQHRRRGSLWFSGIPHLMAIPPPNTPGIIRDVSIVPT